MHSSGSDHAAAGDPFGYVYGTQHIIYRGQDNRIHELYYDDQNQRWEHVIHTSGSDQAAAGDPFGYTYYLLSPFPSKRPLRSLTQQHNIHIGSAVAYPQIQTENTYADTLADEFDMVTPENAMKFQIIHPAQDTFDFHDADVIVDFAEDNNMQVRGHTLVWHSQLPSWLTSETWTRDELIAILQDHITTVVTRYRGRVAAWDVVNEAFCDDGSLRPTFWLQGCGKPECPGIGPEYIEMAFEWAHAADPQAKLFYNDYGAEGSGDKSNAIYSLVSDMVQRGVPIHGVGLQMHVGIDSPPNSQDVAANISRLGAIGLDVHITEMDVKIISGSGLRYEKLIKQAAVYSDMFDVCLSQDACKAFIMWGFTDKYSWIYAEEGSSYPDEAPLIFDPEYNPKFAYSQVSRKFLSTFCNY
jgi:endo-1,4-beta-xylanase